MTAWVARTLSGRAPGVCFADSAGKGLLARFKIQYVYIGTIQEYVLSIHLRVDV